MSAPEGERVPQDQPVPAEPARFEPPSEMTLWQRFLYDVWRFLEWLQTIIERLLAS